MTASLRDRFVRYFQGERGVQPPFMYVFGPMRQTLERWLDEGMAEEHEWFRDVGFEGEPGLQFGNRPAVNAFVCPTFEVEVLHDDGRIRTVRNSWGTVVKGHSDGSTMSIPHEFPVTDAETWQAMKERLLPGSGERFGADWEQEKPRLDAATVPTSVGGLPCGFFGAPRELFGLERWLLTFYDTPALAHDVLDTLCELWCELFSRIASEIRVDFLFIWEDMCYRGGPLVSPAIFREFMLPRYRRLIETLRGAGVPLMLVDTDGDCTELLPLFVEAGVDMVIPFEVAAGTDTDETRRGYPTLGIVGGIEKTMPSKSPQAIEAELSRIATLLRAGRYLPCSDHGVPPTVSYAQYVEFYRRLREVMARTGARAAP